MVVYVESSGATRLRSVPRPLTPAAAVSAGTAAEALAISPKLRAQWTDEVFTIQVCVCVRARALVVALLGGWLTRVRHQTFGDGLVAVVAGVVANQVTGYAGTPVAVFNVAAVVGVSVAAACTLLWTENYGSVRRASAAARVPVRVDLTWVVLLLCVVVVIRALLVLPRWVISLPPAGLSWRTRPCSCRA